MIHMVQPPSTWRVIATVITAVTMKTIVAAIERGESRPIPQMPWPEVQPPPGRGEPDQQSRCDNDGPTRGQLGLRHAVTDPASDDQRENDPGDKSAAPAFVFAA